MEIGHQIVRIGRDKEREFDNVDIDFFCDSNGIKHENSTPRTPNRMEWLKEKVEFFKNWQESCFTCTIPLYIFGLKSLILLITLPIRFFLGLEQRRRLMNCGLGENLALSTLEHLIVSVIYSKWEKPRQIRF